MRPVRIGCSGWNYKHWRELVYPKGLPARLWLEHYATLFDTVEVNATFYRLPTRSAVAAWVEQSPPGFVFAVKASRYLTHIKRLTELAGRVELFYERLDPLVHSPKLGPVLWQLPGTFKLMTSVWPRRSSACPPAATASSSGMRAGSSPTCTRSCASTGRRS